VPVGGHNGAHATHPQPRGDAQPQGHRERGEARHRASEEA